PSRPARAAGPGGGGGGRRPPAAGAPPPPPRVSKAEVCRKVLEIAPPPYSLMSDTHYDEIY
ncbi:MAG: hypothetical protein LBK25_09605, partial [Treponema sp.]|nr:hypothetical protein [Treponema sp.]